MVITRVKKGLVGLALTASLLGGAVSPAVAATKTYSLSNGCNIKAENVFASNQASSGTWKNGGTCYSVSTNFRYWDPNSGIYRTAGGSYTTGNVGSATAFTPNKPSVSNHNARATNGGTAWGIPLNF